MAREDILKEVLSLTGNNFLLELPTGVGKTRIALEKIKKLNGRRKKNLLIVVPRNVLKITWKEEIHKWWKNCPLDITYTTYVSFPKYKGIWEYVVWDECFRGSTEVLTDKGFKRFDSLAGDEKIAQFNKDSSIEFVKPIRFIKKYHAGELCKLSLGRSRSVYMTPNHNQVYRTKADTEWKFKPIKDLSLQGYTSIPVSGLSKENGDSLSWMERLLIAIQADGTLQRHQVNESVYSIQVVKQRKKDRLHLILSHLNNYTIIKGREGVDRYMVKLPKGDAKLLSTHFSVEMGITKARQFIEEIAKWDGSELTDNTLYYSSKIKENVDFVNAIAVQAGYKVLQSTEEDNRSENYSTIYRLYMRKETLEVHSRMSKEYIPYSGYVYCVEVPSHMIVVRSEGYTFISGNCHHLSERCREALCDFSITYSILCSATINRVLKDELREVFSNITIYKKNLRDIIEDDILPDPKVYLIPLKLQTGLPTETIMKNPKARDRIVECNWANRWEYITQRSYPVKIYCSEFQYYQDLCSQIDYWKKKAKNSSFYINKWMKLCLDRLKWLSDKKVKYTQRILTKFLDYRTIVFCNSIEQTELLGEYCINSKNKKSLQYLEDFNSNRIDHITSCSMINEGLNLTNCQIGIFNNVNASETISIQRVGRILRHSNPILIIPYFINTREEELVKRMLENYNPDLITKILDIDELEI